MSIPRKLIAGNWKMNGLGRKSGELAAAVADACRSVDPRFDMLICPPFTLISCIRGIIDDGVVKLGGQDCSPEAAGAFTGDIAAPMLKDIGCAFVILGHSERRHGHGESNELIRAKAEAAHAAGLVAIICVGEIKEERQAGQEKDVVGKQLANSIPALATSENTVIAYEPVWAIGTGLTATPEDVLEMHAFIRAGIAGKIANSEQTRLLYGGSVKPGNAAELLATANVDGVLVGGASLKADDIMAIAKASPVINA